MFPPHRVLAAVDFSDSSRIALNAAARLAAHCGAELIVLHALDPLLAEAARRNGVDLAAETELELTRFVKTAVSSHDVRCLVVRGPAADVICCIAAREQADVIVIGAQGYSAVARVILGSTTERVLRRTTISVCVVPAAWHAPDPAGNDLAGVGPIVVGVDLQSGSAAAAVAASHLSHLLKTRLEIIHVVAPVVGPRRWRPHAERAALEARQHAEEELARLARALRPDVSTGVRVESGDVAGMLVDAATTADGSRPMIVLGRNRGRAADGAPGSVAWRVLTAAAAPVLIYMPAD